MRKGSKHTEETIVKMQIAQTGYIVTESTKEKISKTLKGRKRSPDAIKKTADALRGRKKPPFSKEWRENIGEASRIRWQNPEYKERLINTMKGRIVSRKTKEKLSNINKGKIISPETREKIRNTLKKQLLTHSQNCNCIICKVKKGWRPPHNKKTCQCFICKSRRREYFEETHPNWKGGCETPNRHIRKSKKFKNWQKLIFKKDNYTCLICRQVGGNLNPHHILPFAAYPKHRFNVNNGMTLCKKDHYTLHNKTLWLGIYSAAFG